MQESRAQIVTVVAPDQVNRALGRPVTVSSSTTEPLTANPQNVVDGNTATQWVSASNDVQSVLIDLGQRFESLKVVLSWGSNFATRYRLAISGDGVLWTLLRSVPAGTGGTAIHDSLSGEGRYFKILLDKRHSTTSGYALREVAFFGIPATSGAGSSAELPAGVTLQQNYPNPFNGQTRIEYQLGSAAWVRLAVFDLLGREVAVLADERREAGLHAVTFDAGQVASGVYYYRLQVGTTVQTRGLIVVR